MAACVAILLPGAASGADTDPLAALTDRWERLHDYTMVVATHERLGDRVTDRRIRYSFLKPNHSRFELLDGPNRGTRVLWNGGDRVVVRPGGVLSFVHVTYDVHDAKVTSPRGNTVVLELGPILDCYRAQRDRVTFGAAANGKADLTDIALVNADGVRCAGDPPGDRDVTRDVMTVSKISGLPVRRERFAGDQSVERYDIEELRLDVGLKEGDFR